MKKEERKKVEVQPCPHGCPWSHQPKHWHYRKNKDCVFCKKIKDRSVTFSENGLACYFQPLNPVVAGHLLVIPTYHASDVSDSVSAQEAIKLVALLTNQYENCNIITSKGSDATQTVFHLHFHIIPRIKGDGLKLPWTDQILKDKK